MMKGADGTPLNIIKRIAAGDYMTFGMLLLQDENGVEINVIKKKHIQEGPESVTQAILQKWLTRGSPTCTYQHLIKRLRESELGRLAKDITNSLLNRKGMPGAIFASSFCFIEECAIMYIIFP